MKKFAWVALLFTIAVPLAYAVHLYPYLPDSIPTHFNAKGEADQFGGRNSIFVGPSILGAASLLVFLLLVNIRKIDPKRYQKADNDLFWQFALFIAAFMSCLSVLILYITAHPGVSFSRLLLPAMGIFFAGMGAFMPRFHQNYFAGLRLPWTLDNEANWNATHKMGGKVWMVGGVAMALAALVLPQGVAFAVFMGILLVMVAIPIVFSYRMFRHGNKTDVT